MLSWRKLWPVAFLLATLFAGSLFRVVYAAETTRHDVEIVAVDDSEATRRIVADLRKKLPSAQLASFPSKRVKSNRTIYITIGPSALRHALTQGLDGDILSLFTSSQTYHSILDSTPAQRQRQVTAIYAEPSPLSQLQLLSRLHKNQPGVAVILTSKTAYLEPILQGAAAQLLTPLTIERFNNGDDINRVLNRIADVPAILAVPDGTVYSVDNIRNILVTSYRRTQPVIGFSAALVKAGALASTYSDIEDIDTQADELLNDFNASGKFPAPQFPKYFSVAVNEGVARSLNIVIDDSARKFSRKPTVRQP